MKKTISTPNAPAAIGPYSQAIACGHLLFTSGQIPLSITTGEVVVGNNKRNCPPEELVDKASMDA